MGSLQGSKKKHDSHADLLLPIQPQGKHLAHGQGNHPQINGQANGRIQPPIQINIDTYALCRIKELLPVEVDGDALENGARDKDQAVQDVEGHRRP